MDKIKLEQYVEDGLSQRQIAQLELCTQSTVGRWLRKLDIRQKGREKDFGKCEHCGADIQRGSTRFCSVECQARYKYLERLNGWLDGTRSPGVVALRGYLKDIRGCKCEVCNSNSWMNKPIPLEVEHIDGNSTNNAPNNVMLICPNCHAQTDTYKGKNRGNGRHSRRERYSKGLSY